MLARLRRRVASTASPCAGTRTSSRSSTSRSRGSDCSASTAASASAARSTLEDAWQLGFDHIAIAAGAGTPTIVGMKNNLVRGIRKASRLPDGAAAHRAPSRETRSRTCRCGCRRSSSAAASPRSTRRPSCSRTTPCRSRRSLERYERSCAELRRGARCARASTPRSGDPRRAASSTAAASATSARAPRREGRAAGLHAAGAQLGRRHARLPQARCIDSPAYRLNHEEVVKALEEGIALRREPRARSRRCSTSTAHVQALRLRAAGRRRTASGRTRGEIVELPARTVCVAAGTSPNVIYEKEQPGHVRARRVEAVLPAAPRARRRRRRARASSRPSASEGFFTSYRRRRARGHLLRRQPPALRGQRRQGDGLSARTATRTSSRCSADDIARARSDEPQAARDAQLARALRARSTTSSRRASSRVDRLTPTIVEVVVRAPAAARKFEPGQFYRLQNFESLAPVVDGTRLAMEGLALTGAWVDKEKGLLVADRARDGRLVAPLRGAEAGRAGRGDGTDRHADRDPAGRDRAARRRRPRQRRALLDRAALQGDAAASVIYFAGYKKGEDLFKQRRDRGGAPTRSSGARDTGADDRAAAPAGRALPRQHRPGDAGLRRGRARRARWCRSRDGRAHHRHRLRPDDGGGARRRGTACSQPHLEARRTSASARINSPMQCMMKEVCAQCLQKHVDPETGKETFVFSCFNQDQHLDHVDFTNLDRAAPRPTRCRRSCRTPGSITCWPSAPTLRHV